MFSTKLLIETR